MRMMMRVFDTGARGGEGRRGEKKGRELGEIEWSEVWGEG